MIRFAILSIALVPLCACAQNPLPDVGAVRSVTYCRQTACNIGYIFLPSYNGNAPLMGDLTCAPSLDGKTFSGDPLPDEGQVVTMFAEKRGLFQQDYIENHADSFQGNFVDASHFKSPNCIQQWGEPEGRELIIRGDRVRILGYRTFVGHHLVQIDPNRTGSKGFSAKVPRQLLFALVNFKWKASSQ